MTVAAFAASLKLDAGWSPNARTSKAVHCTHETNPVLRTAPPP